MRTTKKELTNAFGALCRACGREPGYGIGEWHLSAWSSGDGVTRYTVQETTNENGGITHPLSGLLGRAAACQAFWFAARAADVAYDFAIDNVD